MQKPVTMNAATSMCTDCGPVAGLNMAPSGSTPVILPSTRSKPRGWFIQALALTTQKVPTIPAIRIGTAAHMCVRAGRRSQP